MAQNPYQNDDFDKASEYFRLALAMLSKYGIAPSPMNYRLAYDFIAGRSRELKQSLDAILSQSEGPLSDKVWELYQEYFIQDDKALEKIRQELHQVIVSIQTDSEDSTEHLSDYQKTLSDFANILGTDTSMDAMSSEVHKVIQNTQSMEESQQQLESNLSNVMTEVESLKKELEQVRQESLTDTLTGISNRKAFDAVLEDALQQASREREPFSLVMIDIDHFKIFNDTYGHLVGDKVLRFVASIIKNSLSNKQMVARFGGEEFVIALPQTAMAAAEDIAERIRMAISKGNLKNKGTGQDYGTITASLGIAQFSMNELSTDLIQRADQALYIAKESGRNRVEKAALH